MYRDSIHYAGIHHTIFNRKAYGFFNHWLSAVRICSYRYFTKMSSELSSRRNNRASNSQGLFKQMMRMTANNKVYPRYIFSKLTIDGKS
ncbi:hypothetical protein D3C81_1485160 [compost metagenome]